jgi:hypothetical protein
MWLSSFVIPGRRQRVRPEVAGPMTGFAASPESIFTSWDYGFLARAFGASRNDASSS